MNYNKNSFLGMFPNLFIGYADALLSTFGSPSIPPAPTQTDVLAVMTELLATYYKNKSLKY
jgi:hypothetical protein